MYQVGLVEIFAHRGANREKLENSLAAFQLAAPVSDVLETDVRFTADNAVVLFHDPTVDRIAATATGPVESYTLAQLHALDYVRDGVPATLEDLLHAFPSHRINIDIKDSSFELAATVGDVLRSMNASSRTTVGSFHGPLLEAFREHCPEVSTSLHPGEVRRLLRYAWSGGSFSPPAGACCAQVPVRYRLLPVATRPFVSAAHRAGMVVHAWTVNSERVLRACFRRGVDGIITDDPLWARQVVDRLAHAQ